MILIANALNGHKLPNTVPEALLKSLHESVAVPAHVPLNPFATNRTTPMVSSIILNYLTYKVDWTISEANKIRYEQVFNSLDTAKTGYLPAATAATVLAQSGLPQPILATIWYFCAQYQHLIFQGR